jgi:hypothetical protein
MRRRALPTPQGRPRTGAVSHELDAMGARACQVGGQCWVSQESGIGTGIVPALLSKAVTRSSAQWRWSEIEPNDRLPRLTTRSNLCLSVWAFLEGGIELRIRSWIVVLASGVGLYAVLAGGFHWFVEPVILAGRSRLPTETLVAHRNSVLEGPATSGHSLPAAVTVSSDRSEPPSPADSLVMAKAVDEADSKVPDNKPAKKETNRSVTRRANDRVVQQSAERRGSWNFSSSPASPNYR